MHARAGLVSLGLAARFVGGTVAGRLVAFTVALCVVVSFLELGVGYREKAFLGATTSGMR